jgi:hypothetical protein
MTRNPPGPATMMKVRADKPNGRMGFTPHPTNPSILYASGHPAGGGNLGFIASEDGGRSWSQAKDGAGCGALAAQPETAAPLSRFGGSTS